MLGDAAMALAAVDRLVHHSTIFELNVESYRRKAAAARAPRKLKNPSDSKRDSDQPNHNTLPAAATQADVRPTQNAPDSSPP